MIPTQTLKPKSVAREAPDDVAAKSHSAGRRRKEMFSSMKSGRRIVPLVVATATVALGLVAAPQAWAHTYLHAATAAITGDPIKARLDNAVYDWWAQPVSVNDGALTVGAGVRHRAAERSDVVRDAVPLLAEAMPLIGHAAIRTRC